MKAEESGSSMIIGLKCPVCDGLEEAEFGALSLSNVRVSEIPYH